MRHAGCQAVLNLVREPFFAGALEVLVALALGDGVAQGTARAERFPFAFSVDDLVAAETCASTCKETMARRSR